MYKLLNNIIYRRIKDKIKSTQKYQKFKSKELALSSKRLDICASQFAHTLHLTPNLNFRDKICLEIGSGRVLSHALICYLLGAKKVIATDVTSIAHTQFIYNALHESVVSIIRDVLSPFEDHTRLRERLNNLLRIKKFDLEQLNKIGIEYIAPIDLEIEKLNYEVDVIYSNSVLEHVSINDIKPLIQNLTDLLKPKGKMIHRIHLEDHKNISNDPFGFLSIPEKQYPPLVQSKRGNRVRKSKWLEVFNNIEGLQNKLFYEWIRKDRDIPSTIDKSIGYKNEEDLLVSHIGIYSEKQSI